MTRKERTINIALWVAQSSLAASLLFASILKLTQPISDLLVLWPWLARFSKWTIALGILEMLLGLGIIIPELLRLGRKIVPFSAAMLIIYSLFSNGLLLNKGEIQSAAGGLVSLLLCVFVLWGRSKSSFNTPT